MQYRYYADVFKNYLILPLPAGKPDYQYHMLTANRIRGIVPCSIRSSDGERELYCDITALQSLADLYENRRMSRQCLQELLEALLETGEWIGEYLLEMRRLLLRPEFIFYDFVRSAYLFVYYPGQQEENPYNAFSAFIAEHTEEEKGAASAAYAFAAASEQPAFVLNRSWMRNVFEEGGLDVCTDRAREQVNAAGEGENAAEAGSARTEKERRAQEDCPFSEEDAWNDVQEDGAGVCAHAPASMEKETAAHRSTLAVPAVILAAAGLLQLLRIYAGWTAPIREYAGYGVTALLFAALLAGIAGIVMSRRSSRKEIRREYEEEQELERSRTIPTYEAEAAGGKPGCGSEDDVWAGGTGKEMHKLYGTGDNRMMRIDLSHLPCTVGALSDFCDTVIADPSVSAVHVRFAEEEGELTARDLGSAGGTYLNGRKLNMHERYPLKEGDEIRIGRLTFCCR
jgi:hypothetical protein